MQVIHLARRLAHGSCLTHIVSRLPSGIGEPPLLSASFIVRSTRRLEENPWMIYGKLFNLCFFYLLTSSQPEPSIFPLHEPPDDSDSLSVF